MNNGVGIAGLAPSAQLLVAKVVTKSRAIPVEAEARAIRWAVDNGARVINMSLGGIRDPLDPERDTYSRLEADAVAYAISNGVVVVAAVGNSDQAPANPWKYASYPAALPHVLGVSAVTETGAVPDLLQSRPRLQRHRRPWPEDPLGAPATADRPLPAVQRAGILELRPRGVPRGAGDVVRRAAGERGCGGAAEPAARRCGPSR